LSLISHYDLGAARPLRQNLLLALRPSRTVDPLGRGVVGSPGFRVVAKRDPGIVLAAAGVQMGASRGMVEWVAGGGLDVLAEADEEKAQDGNGAEDDDEPHFRQHPRVQRVDGVG